jgi:hypothetical protein
MAILELEMGFANVRKSVLANYNNLVREFLHVLLDLLTKILYSGAILLQINTYFFINLGD